MRANNRSREHGFTLIEVLAALVIIALGMMGVIEAISQTATNSTRMRDRTIAHWVAMNRLTAARLETRAPNIAKTSDEVEMGGRRWRWTMEVTETPVQTMRRIDVRVAEAEGGDDERAIATVSGFYGTAIAAAGMTAPIWTGAPVAGPGTPGTEQPPQGEPSRDQPGRQPETGGETVDTPVNEQPQEEGQ
jgi:general secretion pathway protein I